MRTIPPPRPSSAPLAPRRWPPTSPPLTRSIPTPARPQCGRCCTDPSPLLFMIRDSESLELYRSSVSARPCSPRLRCAFAFSRARSCNARFASRIRFTRLGLRQHFFHLFLKRSLLLLYPLVAHRLAWCPKRQSPQAWAAATEFVRERVSGLSGGRE
jgi:hypothetical protein